MKNTPLRISNIDVQPGERLTLALRTPELYTCAPIYIPIHVVHGKKTGPVLLVCGSIHGDEINGVAIIQRLMKLRLLNQLKGTLIVIPTINIYGMMMMSRTLPDRRDLDGSFPGSEKGSYASRLAYFLNKEVFTHITHCIDLHTGEPHISKFPQIKTNLENIEAAKMAKHFQAPVMFHTEEQKGLLWLMHQETPIPTILYETGEALRLDAYGIKLGVAGITRIMRSLNMLPPQPRATKNLSPIQLKREEWVRAPCSGLCEIYGKIGTFVSKGSRLAKIFDPFGSEQREEVSAPFDGMIIARNNLPILNEGEPILQLAEVQDTTMEKLEKWSEVANGDMSLE